MTLRWVAIWAFAGFDQRLDSKPARLPEPSAGGRRKQNIAATRSRGPTEWLSQSRLASYREYG